MERVKQALDQARRERQGLERATATPDVVMKELDPATEARIRRLTPINQLPRDRQDTVIGVGEVMSFPRGSWIFHQGSRDEYVHYLVGGTVAILVSGQIAKRLSAESGMSTVALDEPGEARVVSVTAENRVQVFRVEHAVLQREAEAAGLGPPPRGGERDRPAGGEDLTDVEPVQPAFYAQTHTGQRLAALVEEIHSNRTRLARAAQRDPAEETAGQTSISLDEDLFDLGIEGLDRASSAPQETEPGAARHEPARDPIGSAFAELERAIRRQIEAARRQERERIEQHLQQRVDRIRKRAEQLLRETLLQARARDRERAKAAEDRLQQQYEKLTQLANKITHQKAEIQRARHQLEQKLRAADEVHRELAELGLTMTRELDHLEGMMPDAATGILAR